MISIIGAGKSSLFLIEYLADYCHVNQLTLTVYDRELTPTISLLQSKSKFVFENLDLVDSEKLELIVKRSQLLVSMLPADLHFKVAELCLKHKVHLATASYVSEQMKAIHIDVKAANLIFINEMGLDPGIDHMSAMKIMDEIRSQGGEISSFESYTGGLMADEDDADNPWKYKFSWNPRNVILAAQGSPAQYLENSKIKLKPYHRVFNDAKVFDIEGYGQLEAYPNRDSLKYIDLYNLKNVKNMIRGTFRKVGFCDAWNVFVQLGMTDNQLKLSFSEKTSLQEWMKSYLPESKLDIKLQLKDLLNLNDPVLLKLDWLGFFENQKMPILDGTSAQILEELLKKKWMLQKGDKDLIVMLHRIEYIHHSEVKNHESVMILKGEDEHRTAMAKTVGLPLAIACKLIIENKISQRGVVVPMEKEIYSLVLKELETMGIVFKDSVN
jgi:saccharopine dehydrogenase-like NADP-dependent oxidoreductase